MPHTAGLLGSSLTELSLDPLFEEAYATFSVGPNKEIVKVTISALVKASPVFRKLFEDKVDQVIENNDENTSSDAILLVDINPFSFKIFLRFMSSESVKVEKLENMKLLADEKFDLKRLAAKFEMANMKSAVDRICDRYVQQFASFVSTFDYYKLSSHNLALLLSSDNLDLEEIDIFKHVCRWAEYRRVHLGLTLSQANVRKVMGDCLKEIRFPLMKPKDLGTIVYARNILTCDELLNTFLFIANEESNGKSFDKNLLRFKTQRRNRTLQ